MHVAQNTADIQWRFVSHIFEKPELEQKKIYLSYEFKTNI